MSANTYVVKQYNVSVDIGSTVIYTAGPNDVTDHGLELDKRYAGIVVGWDGYINDPDHGNMYDKYKIRLFLDDGNDLTITRSELHYHTAKMLDFTELIPTDDGTFRLVNEEFLYVK
jgi:hypothetical protein